MADVDNIYAALRSVVGKGGSAEDDSGIEGLWRRVRANAIASVGSFAERSALQALPNHATDALPYYERLLGIMSDPSVTEEERQALAALLYTQQIASALPDVNAALRAMDERFAVLTTSPAQSDTTIIGRAFEDFAGDEPFGGGRRSSGFPNYSSEFVAFVLFDLGGGIVPTTAERRQMANASRLLHDVLPAWNGFQLATHRGFTLDVDRLDLTSLGA